MLPGWGRIFGNVSNDASCSCVDCHIVTRGIWRPLLRTLLLMSISSELLQQRLDLEQSLAIRGSVFSRSSLLEIYGPMVDAPPTNHKEYAYDTKINKWIILIQPAKSPRTGKVML